ncbi:hypothetical protein FACS1894200_10600 [Spirochaetia bacterium]|nr:hypothetical protein FACS1894200_10600 [Spirochaetia bacterium]
MGSNLIPIAGKLLYDFLVNIMPLITANTAAWNIPTSAVSDLQDSVTPFMQAWLIFITPNSGKVDRDNLNVTLKAVRSVMAAFVKAYILYNPLVDPAILVQMGFGPKPKPLPGWHTPPILRVENGVRQVHIIFKGTELSRQGKAAGTHHIELCIKDTPERPMSVNDYTRMEEATKSPLVLTCTLNLTHNSKCSYSKKKFNHKGHKEHKGRGERRPTTKKTRNTRKKAN